MKKIINTMLAIAVMLVVIVTGCSKDTTVKIKLRTVEISDTVHFKTDLVPLFTKNCALSGCHADGGKSPNLTATKAYTSLMNDPDYVNVANPEGSELYKRLIGAISPAMPMGRTTNPDNINAKVLAWIKQGAKNN